MDQLQDQFFLKETLKLAKKGMGWTNPNPMVSAVLVKNGRIIGKGYHKKVGFPHAEIEAIKSSKESVEGATLYVNLEPCSHFGRTPPCVDVVIKAKIARIVCSTLDPNPKVHGKGVAILKKAGVEVSVGILEDQARLLNEAFFTFHEKKRPFVALKFAASLDGKIATKTGESKWITNEKARVYARKLRSEYQAVLAGINTIIKDNPHLGVRIKGKKDPLRIILDSQLKMPLNSKALRDKNVFIATTTKVDKNKLSRLKKMGIEVAIFEGTRVPIPNLLKELKERGIISILVEGGKQILGSFVDQKIVDKVYAFYAPIIIGGDKAVNTVGGEGVNFMKDSLHLKSVSFQNFDDNLLVTGSIFNPRD